MSRWPVVPLRRAFRIVNGGTPLADSENWGGEIPWATPIDLAKANGRILSATDRALTQAGLRTGSRLVGPGSLIVSTRAPIGYVVEVDKPMAFNQGCRGLVPSQSADTRFFRYQLDSMSSRLAAAGQGSTFQELTTDGLGRMGVVLPLLSDQVAVARYLDREVQQLQSIVLRKRALVDRMRERAEATLQVRTLERWSTEKRVPIKRVATRSTRLGLPSDEVLTAYRDGQVTTRNARRADGYTVADDESSYLHVDRGDLVFHGLDGFAGAVGVAERDGKCSSAYHVCKVEKPNSAEFLAQQLRALAAAGFIALQASSVRQRAVDLRNWDRFGAIELWVPQAEVQETVASEVKSVGTGCKRTDALLSRQIDLLLEHRQALITAAVTGELDIPGAAA